MVEVNDAILVGGTTVAAALVGMMLCCGGGDKKEAKSHAKAKEVKAPPKAKKEEPRAAPKTVKSAPAAAAQKPTAKPSAAKQQETPKQESAPPAPAVSTAVAEEDDFIVPVKSKKKKQQMQQQTSVSATASVVPSTAPAITVGAPTAAATAPVRAPAAASISDGWEIVEDKKKTKAKKAAATPSSAPPAAPTPVPAAPTPAAAAPTPVAAAPAPTPAADVPVTFNINVENKKIGIIIGVKGATLKAIQEATGTTINTPKNINTGAAATGVSVVTVTGPQEGVSRAAKAVGELAKKGYCSLLAGENFAESPLSVHTSFVPDLVGKGGACIKALQEKLKVRVNISQTPSKDNTVKVVIAGAKDDVATARQCIADILSVRHSSITHPNVVHTAIDVPPEKYKFIIGSKGAEIRHIENNFKVSLYIPSEVAPQDGKVLVVGEAPAVAAAERYVLKIIADKNDQEENADQTWQQDAANTDDGPQEEWMQQYTFREQSQPLVSPSVLAAAAPKKDATTAWRDTAQK